MGAHRHASDFPTLHSLELITLLIGRLSDSSVGHIWTAVVTQNGEDSLLCIGSSP